ncbi:YggS family pyridoxal phosphate-dependent enzyme [Mesobacillus subterraneus]|uniref:YggS family pyridoxal phosphate-dependent enzyme n=1 Tax=Mesobacillus subterraneus TaxID=285983 RepID=UPI0020420B9F|nr:YggS family pyridoxal phosphate-dependent enzyme [Mesobacillus subterraneus]MCM3665710.1 YggS family pyridoxal phosphate-dependent enzyme [Mesobacillus subterraneus]MCM3684455.1 YggS family pyridoxal phosphate-dependent enzyme [Mesobacillus subterraneus]
MKVSENLEVIQSQIAEACKKANRSNEEVKIIAVTKYVSAERTQEAIEAGVVNLGENRDEGLLEKIGQIKDKPIWHFIGTLQTRKVKNIIDHVTYIHSLDRLSLAKEINKRAASKVNCLIQVNASGEESKHGLEPEDVLDFVSELKQYSNILVSGLMTMAPNTEDEQVIRDCFKTMKNLQGEIQSLKLDYAPCNELSMGMSNDFQIAVEEGSTMVRIGTALVGNESEVQ